MLNDLRFQLAKFNASTEDLDALAASIRQLDELFLLVIVGEFNAGKSAFINALLGQALLKEGVTPTTTQITILQFGEEVKRQPLDHNQSLLNLPADFLQEISIVDTPGTNTIIREHEALTSQFVPRADLILFVTSADRPFTESERAFLEKLRNWGKKVVIVLNKIDILQNDDELDQIAKFILENSKYLLGM
ncbi:MAG TPA: dynamin family protein, partial [Anaerolineales bacterium]|nr:dynamin family protein [Anaerolineales bacterium]